LPGDYTFSAADHGSHTFANVTLTDSGTQPIVATDSADSIAGSEDGIIVHDPGVDYIPIADARDLIYDPTRDVLYITATDGTLQRYDLATETLLDPFQVGASLNAGDITPDGSSLYVGDGMRGLTQGWFRHV